jgi:hypothetical protein
MALTLALLLAAAVPARPILITVDDLPLSTGLHRTPAEREAVTRGLLAALARHGIRAVGQIREDVSM